MKFCMVTTFFPPYNMGGDGVYVSRLCEALARRGHQVDVVHDIDAFRASGGGQSVGDRALVEGVSVVSLESKYGTLSPLMTHQTGRAWLKGPLKARLEQDGYDVVHFHNISLIGLDALGWGNPAVRLMTLHEHWLVCPMSILWRYDREPCDERHCVTCTVRGGRPPQLWRNTNWMQRQLQHLDRVIAPTDFVRRSHLERGLSLPFEILPHFVPDAAPVASDEVPHARPFFLYSGRLIKAKGVQSLLAAFARPDGPDLLIAGDGDYAHELRRMAADLPRVVFLGRQSQDALRRLYRHALAVLVPSMCYEVFGLVVAEALATGTPVVARDHGALAELVRQSGGGLLFSTDAEIPAVLDRMAGDAALRADLAARGREVALRSWSEAAHVESYLRIVEQVADERRAGVRRAR